MAPKIKFTEVSLGNITFKFGYFKTVGAVFKLIELVFAIVLISTMGFYYTHGYTSSGDLIFLMVIVTFFICTICLFISEFILWTTMGPPPHSKSVFEIVFFCVSSVLILTTSMNLVLSVNVSDDKVKADNAFIACSVIGLLLCILYAADITFSLYSRRDSNPKASSNGKKTEAPLGLLSSRHSNPKPSSGEKTQQDPFSINLSTEI